MKIGIITWYFGANYGARAHSLALQEIVKELGHECEMINYSPRKTLLINLIMNLNCEKWKKHVILTLKCIIRCLKFVRQKKMFNETNKITCVDELNLMDFDCLIYGSDEIWKLDHPLCCDFYFGVGCCKRRFTYAVSSGQTSSYEKLTLERLNSLKEMSQISVRDEHTQKFIYNNLNIFPSIVLDPTLLYDFAKYEKPLKVKNNYILIYSFSFWNEYQDKICNYAQKQNLKIVSIGRYCKWADYSYDMASFQEWLGSFKNAKIVITDSFHGVVFAIKNCKEFILLGREDKKNKINDLLKLVDISKIFYDGKISIEEYCETYPINYKKVKEVLDKKKKESIWFLKQSISG